VDPRESILMLGQRERLHLESGVQRPGHFCEQRPGIAFANEEANVLDDFLTPFPLGLDLVLVVPDELRGMAPVEDAVEPIQHAVALPKFQDERVFGVALLLHLGCAREDAQVLAEERVGCAPIFVAQ
jgi:hypothetical protein